MKIGVLALQGDFDAHRRRLEELGAEVVLVKKARATRSDRRARHPRRRIRHVPQTSRAKPDSKSSSNSSRLKPTFGTCAGAILLAYGSRESLLRPDSAPSTSASAATPTDARSTAPSAKGKFLTRLLKASRMDSPLEMVFIRAPKIVARWRRRRSPRDGRQRTRSPSGREERWPQPSIPNSPTIPASTRPSWIWSPTAASNSQMTPVRGAGARRAACSASAVEYGLQKILDMSFHVTV